MTHTGCITLGQTWRKYNFLNHISKSTFTLYYDIIRIWYILILTSGSLCPLVSKFFNNLYLRSQTKLRLRRNHVFHHGKLYCVSVLVSSCMLGKCVWCIVMRAMLSECPQPCSGGVDASWIEVWLTLAFSSWQGRQCQAKIENVTLLASPHPSLPPSLALCWPLLSVSHDVSIPLLSCFSFILHLKHANLTNISIREIYSHRSCLFKIIAVWAV